MAHFQLGDRPWAVPDHRPSMRQTGAAALRQYSIPVLTTVARETRMPRLHGPPFSWSNSRHKKQERCPRLVYLHHYVARGGHRADATDDQRLAFLLKQLVTLDMLLGTILHEFAQEFVLAIRDGCPLPTGEALLFRARQTLNAACLASRDRPAFLWNPRKHTMLREIYYERELAKETIERIASKLRICVEHLCSSALWRDLAGCRTQDLIIVDSLATFVFEGTLVYAAPDLAYRLAEDLTIVDWKTGHDQGALEQILVYALFLRDGLGVPYRARHWYGRIINLRDGTDAKVRITPDLLQHATERMRRSIAQMKLYLADPERNIPKPKDAFPLIPSGNRKLCTLCAYLQLCSEELEQVAAQPCSFSSLVSGRRRCISPEF